MRSAANQAELMLHAARALLVKQRTMLVNAIRGHAAEFGVTAAKGAEGIKDLLQRIAADPEVPALAREIVTMLAQQITRLEIEIRVLEKKLMTWHRTNECSRRLTGIPGVGPIGAAALAMKVPDPAVFRSISMSMRTTRSTRATRSRITAAAPSICGRYRRHWRINISRR